MPIHWGGIKSATHNLSCVMIFPLFFFFRRLSNAMRQYSVAICSSTLSLCCSTYRTAGQCLTICLSGRTEIRSICTVQDIALKIGANWVCNNDALVYSVCNTWYMYIQRKKAMVVLGRWISYILWHTESLLLACLEHVFLHS